MARTVNTHAIVVDGDCYRLVGSLPIELLFANEDGSAPSTRQREAASHCGPGFARPKLRARRYTSPVDAVRAILDSGLEITGRDSDLLKRAARSVDSATLRKIERVYADPSAAHERAMRWRNLGLRSVTVEPHLGSRRSRVYVLTALATDEQVRAL